MTAAPPPATTTMQPTTEDPDDVPNQYLPIIINYLKGFHNDTVDFSKPYLKPTFATVYPLLVAVYALLIAVSTLANLAMVGHVFKYDLHKDPTCVFLINIAISNLIDLVVVLPITLVVTLLHNWIFGQFLCFCLPMLQDTPIHVSMMTYLLIAGDRYRLLNDPRKPRMPAFVCALGTWFFAICIVLPYPVYMTYLDLRNFGEAEQSKQPIRGLQMCMANLADDMQEYTRSLFIGTYVAPLTIAAYLFVKSGQELQNQEGPLAVAVFEARAKDSTSYSRQGSNTSNDIALTIQGKRGSESVGTSGTVAFSNLSTSYDLNDSELDVQKEKRTQKYLIFMVTSFAACLCPLMILGLVKFAVEETYDNSPQFDVAYVMFVWVAFLPTFLTPCLYASWQMSRPAKERLRGYFRFSNRRHTRVDEEGHRAASGRARHHSNLAVSNSMSAGTPRSRTGSGNSAYGSTAALGVGSSSCPRSPRSSNGVPPDSPSLSLEYSPCKSVHVPCTQPILNN